MPLTKTSITIPEGSSVYLNGFSRISTNLLKFTESVLDILLRELKVIAPLYTINNTAPINGNIELLNSLCISVVSDGDPDYLLLLGKKNTIQIFDGCDTCQISCQDVLDFYYRLYALYYWLIWLKNCILYTLSNTSVSEGGSAGSNLATIKTPIPLDFPIISNCKIQDKIKPSYWMYGLLLLQQYKAAVAIWNFLVNKSSLVKSITTTPLDFSGIDITLKKSFDFCNLSLDLTLVKLTIEIKQDPAQTLPTDNSSTWLDWLKLLYEWAGSGHICLFACMNASNTYILSGTDRGPSGVTLKESLGSSTTITYNCSSCFCGSESGSEAISATCESTSESNATVDSIICTITFNVALKAVSVLSASVKVIPLWCSLEQAQGLEFKTPISLETYVENRPQNTLISIDLQKKFFSWNITYQWDELKATTLKYNSAYTRYNTKKPKTKNSL